jgi:DNA polymerase-4
LNNNHNNRSALLTWLYFDLDCYFASVEEQLNPFLQGKPIIIVPNINDASTAISASYEARKFGIKTGTKVYEAKKLCKDIVCVVARPKVYVHYHHLIWQEIGKHLLIDHTFSIDEGACMLTGKLQEEAHALEIAIKIKQSLKETIGKYITCSIGISTNKFIAKIASNIKKPDGITVIHQDSIQNILSTLNLKDLPGIGRATNEKLKTKGITTISHLYTLPEEKLHHAFGSIAGRRYWYLLRGIDLPTEATQKSSISQSRVLIEEERLLPNARKITIKLILKSAARLRSANLTTGKVTLQLDIATNKQSKAQAYVQSQSQTQTLKQSVKILRTNDSLSLSQAILSCFDSLTQDPKQEQLSFISSKIAPTKPNVKQNTKCHIEYKDTPNPAISHLRKVSISLTDLAAPTRQLSFLNMHQSSSHNTGTNINTNTKAKINSNSNATYKYHILNASNSQKRNKISKAIDTICQKYGTNAVSIGLTDLVKEEHDPIAFGHIPDEG